jgi:hypothetical protein
MNRKNLDIANDLVTHFIQLYTSKFGKRPILNRGKLKFSLAEILEDWSKTELKSFIDYYIKSDSDPDLADFCRRYDEIIHDKEVEENDAANRKQLMSETQKAVLKFREQYKGAK